MRAGADLAAKVQETGKGVSYMDVFCTLCGHDCYHVPHCSSLDAMTEKERDAWRAKFATLERAREALLDFGGLPGKFARR